MHITTVILLWIFHLISLILLICQRSLFNVFFIIFIKNAFLTFFILGVNVFYIYCSDRLTERLNSNLLCMCNLVCLICVIIITIFSFNIQSHILQNVYK